ncbi:unnamed protein product [Schistosoma mattheei]|uniref:Uncharacterized protein n=1 Tax=Schistosoma mattheei TaxID=31246 RepID=A0A3P8KDU9_9TREM|nr:unnamed protein product [Schistosoma mattheei]
MHWLHSINERLRKLPPELLSSYRIGDYKILYYGTKPYPMKQQDNEHGY